MHRCLPGRRAELGEQGGGRGRRLGTPGLQGRDQIHDGGVGGRGAGMVQAGVEEPRQTQTPSSCSPSPALARAPWVVIGGIALQRVWGGVGLSVKELGVRVG